MSTENLKIDEIISRMCRYAGVDNPTSLAKFMGYTSTGTVSGWKKAGEIPPSALKKLADLTGKTVDEISFGMSSGGCITVNIYNMVEAGNGAEPDWHDPVAQRIVPAELLKPHIRTVLVRGRSMEPTFRDGAIIGIDQNDKTVIDGEAYAVLLPYAGAAVKRLYPLPDGVLLRSDNKEFPEVKLKKEDIPEQFILGRVRWVIQEM